MAATYSSLVGIAVGGKYEIRRVLGIGGMGVVCEAMNVDLHKRVALKLIDKTMKESELIVERFRREARAAGQIQSEHIVDVFDMGADKRVGLYMVMEHLVGEDLQTRLEREGKLDVNTAVMIGHQMARGLAKAHAAGVIHRDLKPANVFLTARDNGQLLVKILDFGVSKLLLDQGSARITGSGAPIGTPLYMSPEQAEGRADVDGRADIWSLGAVLYEALSGEPPFADKGSYHGTIVGILTSRPRLLKSVAPWVPIEICAVVDAMLVHDRDARIRNADVVTQRLIEAFPAVLPDGTGRHTAVIVSQAAAIIDATGDTEIFKSLRITGEAPSRPSSTPRSGAPVPSSSPRTASDEVKTIPHPPTSQPGGTTLSSAHTTKAATDVVAGFDEMPTIDNRTPHGHSGLKMKTEPIGVPLHPTPSSPPTSGPAPTPSSHAGGVALPATPPILEPVSVRAPDTERDVRIAKHAERRRYAFVAALGLLFVAFSFAGFYLGRHASRAETPAPANENAKPAIAAVPTPPPPGSADTKAAASASASVSAEEPKSVPPAAASASASTAPSAKPPPKPGGRKWTAPRKAAPAPTASAAATATEAPPPEPPPAPAPVPSTNAGGGAPE